MTKRLCVFDLSRNIFFEVDKHLADFILINRVLLKELFTYILKMCVLTKIIYIIVDNFPSTLKICYNDNNNG